MYCTMSAGVISRSVSRSGISNPINNSEKKPLTRLDNLSQIQNIPWPETNYHCSDLYVCPEFISGPALTVLQTLLFECLDMPMCKLEICTGTGMAGIPVWEWVLLLWEYHGDGPKTCGNTEGMEFIAAGNLRGVWFGRRATIQFF